MINPGDKITIGVLDALATLANAKLAPALPYGFNAFVGKNQIALPKDFTAAADYSAGNFDDGQKVTFRLYGYKVIGGRTFYTAVPLRKAFVGDEGAGDFSMTWTWPVVTGPTAPDGYIVVIPQVNGEGFLLNWKDIGNVHTFTEDGSFSSGWHTDATLDADNGGIPADNLPCSFTNWLKTMNQIKSDFMGKLDLFGGSAITYDDRFLVSGPWCVSVAPRCYLQLNSQAIYKNLKFIYSEADSPTGNQLAPETDMFGIYIGVNNGVNNFNWDADVVINGQIMIFSDPKNQSASDWTVTASHPGITISFNPNVLWAGELPGRVASAFIFDFDEVQYVVGSPIVLTLTPPPGGGVIGGGLSSGDGGLMNIHARGLPDTFATTNTAAIHPAGSAAKSAALPATLTPVTFTSPTAQAYVLPAHHYAFCPGVFVANTLPTMGEMTYLDVDLPQYSPSSESPEKASSWRIPRNDSLPYLPTIGNKSALWPIFRDTDFAPDLLFGKPVNGSPAWQRTLAVKFLNTERFANDPISPFEPSENLTYYSVFVPAGAADVRILTSNSLVTVYVLAEDFPDRDTFNIQAPGGGWISLAESLPGFETDTFYFIGIYNPTGATIANTIQMNVITNPALPNGIFFPNVVDGTVSGNPVPAKEGLSYHFSDTAVDQRPVPQQGYCIKSITIRRGTVTNAAGITQTPSTGTADLPVKIGLMLGFGFDPAGVFTEIQTITIPAGQGSIRATVFLPVLAGAPLAYQSAEIVVIKVGVNFQPMMHSTFLSTTVTVDGFDNVVGYYNGPAWYDQRRALLSFRGADVATPIVLPFSAAVLNDLEAALNAI